MSKNLKRFLLLAAIFLVVVCLPIGFLVAPDQFRSVPVPPNYFASVIVEATPPNAVIADQPDDSLDSRSSTQWAWQEPDISALPPETQDRWQLCMADWVDLFDRYLEIPVKTKDLSVEEAIQELWLLDLEFGKAFDEHFAQISLPYRKRGILSESLQSKCSSKLKDLWQYLGQQVSAIAPRAQALI